MLWKHQFDKPYMGLWDPKGFLGRYFKPTENLMNGYRPKSDHVASLPTYE